MRKQVAEAIEGAIYALQQVAMSHPDSSEHSRDNCRIVSDARMKLVALYPIYDEDDCPGHVASPTNSKVCQNCGVHVDSFRPSEPDGP